MTKTFINKINPKYLLELNELDLGKEGVAYDQKNKCYYVRDKYMNIHGPYTSLEDTIHKHRQYFKSDWKIITISHSGDKPPLWYFFLFLYIFFLSYEY